MELSSLGISSLMMGGGRMFPDLKGLHHAYPMANPAALNAALMCDPVLREKMLQDAAKVRLCYTIQ